KTIAMIGIVFIIAIAGLFYGMEKSKWSDEISMINHENVDYGGGIKNNLTTLVCSPASRQGDFQGVNGIVSVPELTGEVEDKTPDRSYTLTAEKTISTSNSGKKIETWRYTGGPRGAH